MKCELRTFTLKMVRRLRQPQNGRLNSSFKKMSKKENNTKDMVGIRDSVFLLIDGMDCWSSLARCCFDTVWERQCGHPVEQG